MTAEKKLSEHCAEAAHFYSESPGLTGAQTMIDLYYVCEKLARKTETLESELVALRKQYEGHGHG